MSHVRAVFRLLVLSTGTAVLTGWWWVGRVFHRDGLVPWRHRMVGFWARSTLRLLGVRRTVIGTVPPPPCFVVSNHLGYLDVVVLQSVIRSVFVAKSEVRQWPVLGALTAAFDTLYVDRRDTRDTLRINACIRQILESGDGVVIFPEGTSSSGQVVLPFRSALLDYAAQTRWPVYAASLEYNVPAPHPPAETSVCWWGDMTFADHLYRLLRLPTFQAIVRLDPVPVVDSDRKMLGRRLHESVGRLHSSSAPAV